jgi:gluconolactonase
MKIIYCFVLLVAPFFAIAQSPVPPEAKVEVISTGIKWGEGPLWKDGRLLFSDVGGNIMYQWSPTEKTTTPYMQPSNTSNGLALDNQGRMVFCQSGLRRIAREEAIGNIVSLASSYKGKEFNEPNDLVVKSDGSIFFTDPNFGHTSDIGFQGIYRISPSGVVQLLDSTFDKPNGICFSPDEKKLYVDDSPKHAIYMWDVVNDSTIANKKLFYTIPVNANVDGMKTDRNGNVYCSGPTGIWIILPSGLLVDKIATPQHTNNCCWGDADGKTLYITGWNSVYRIRLAASTGDK